MGLLKSKDDRAEMRAVRERAAAARLNRDANPTRRFEHKVKWIHKSSQKGAMGSARMERVLNKAGAEGWELVALEEERAVFKREITEITADELEELASDTDDD